MTGIAHELRYACRTLLRSPGFTITAVIALALGIGANSAIFSVLDAVLLRPLPFPDGDRLMMVYEDASYIGFARNTPAPGNYSDWVKQNKSFSGMAALRFTNANLVGDGPPEALLGRRVTANIFEVLGLRMEFGRGFTAAEDQQNARVVVISHSLWQRRFGGDAAIAGRVINLSGENRTVIGVLPRGIRFPSGQEDYYIPAGFTPQDLANRNSHYLNVVARLKPGVSIEAARADMVAIARRLEQDYPASNLHVGAVVLPLRETMAGLMGRALPVLLAASAFVLLIACTNIANLMLARGWARRREFAVRSALGAGRWALLRPTIAEAAVCSVAGSVLGLAIAALAMRALSTTVPMALGDAASVTLNWRVLTFTIVAGLVTTLMAGVVPALHASRADAAADLKQGARSTADGGMFRRMLVVAEVGLALVLLTGAGLMVKTLRRLQGRDLGFQPESVLTLLTPVGGPEYKEDARRRAYYAAVIDKVQALPGVVRAGFASNLPFTSIGNTNGFMLEGRPAPGPGNVQDALYREVTPGYLETMGVRLRAGRLLNRQDGPDKPRVVVISETFARTYFPEGAVGRRLTMGRLGPNATWYTIVGVVEDMRERGYQLDAKPAMYYADTQVERPDCYYLAVRTSVDPMSLLSAVRQVVWSVAPQMPITRVTTMDRILDRDIVDRRRQMTVLSTFAGLAVLLASIGIYGVLSFLVTQRVKEIGVRMALGATRGTVIGMVARQGGTLIAGGLAIGTLVALAATRALTSMLYGVESSDPATYVSVALGLGALGLVAVMVPAWRASRVDPLRALREE